MKHLKLTDNDVRWVRRMYRPGSRSMRDLAKVFGCSVAYVSDIIRMKRRTSVKGKFEGTAKR